jgi:hypothetical protein
VRVNAVGRLVSGAKSVVTDPAERRAYAARLKWLARGSTLQAWSLEYRRGLTGRFDSGVERFDEQPEQVVRCPQNCGAHAPLSHLYERRYTYRLTHTTVNTTTGATLMCGTGEPPFFVRESISWPFESILSHGLDVPHPKHAESKITHPAVVFPSTCNYYHWLIEELPLLIRATRYSTDFDVLVSENSITGKHKFVAQQLGFTPIAVPRIVNVNEQIMPGRASDSWFIHPEDYQLLSQFGHTATQGQDSSSHEKIYVSRKNSARSLPGESQLEDLLRTQGFFIANLENMAWPEQIALFQGARIIAGPHGAGLSNLVFTEPGATMIELTNGYHYNRCFEWVSHVAGHNYTKVDADAQTTPMRSDQLANAILAHV